MDIRCTHIVGIGNDLVDQLDQLVVLRGVERVAALFLQLFPFIQIGEDFTDAGARFGAAEKQVERLVEIAVAANAIFDFVARKYLRRQPATTHLLRIGCEDHDTLRSIFQRQPLLRFEEIALEVFQQVERLLPVGRER